MTASKFADSALLEAPVAARQLGGLKREFVRYFACSAVALALDAGLFGLGLYLGMTYPVAGAIGFLAGLAIAYFMSVRFVFEHRRMRDERAEFVVFAVIGFGGLALTELLLWLFIGFGNWHPALAKLVTAGFVFCFNFGARKLVLFTKPAEAA